MRPKQKILHMVHSLQVGGLENGLVNLLNRLDPHRFQQTVCCLTSAGKLADRIQSPAIDIVELHLTADRFRFPVLDLARMIRKLNPTIVHTRGWPAVDAVFAACLARVPHIVHGEHGREHTDSEGTNWKRNQIRRIVGRLVDRYVVVCDFFRPWLRESCRVNSDKIIYIPNGVDTAKFHPIDNCLDTIACARSNAAAKQELRVRLGLPADCLLVGSVGRPVLLGSIGGPAAILAKNCIRKVEVLEYPELGMEAIWRIEVENFPAFIVTDDKGNDFFSELKI
jgi:glycosyltransferase involved in cell wall biosynthesis